MLIAVLAWGSLVWQPKNRHGELVVDETGSWRTDGPRLPVEFSRISSDGRLTLALVPGYGHETPVLWHRSGFGDLDAAIGNLAERETHAPREDIHAADSAGIRSGTPALPVGEAVRSWVAARDDVDAAIWTGLPPGPRWAEHGHDGFSPDAAIAYAASLQGKVRERTAEYVERAPVSTPLRPRLAAVLAG